MIAAVRGWLPDLGFPMENWMSFLWTHAGADRTEQKCQAVAGKGMDEDGLEPRGQLLVRLVGQAVLDGGRSMDPARLASMTKRLAGTALQSGVGEVMGLLASLDRMLRSVLPCPSCQMFYQEKTWASLAIIVVGVYARLRTQPHTPQRASEKLSSKADVLRQALPCGM